jgi:hypothetical protein
MRYLIVLAFFVCVLFGVSPGAHANKSIGKRVKLVQLLNPERQVFVPFTFSRFAPPGRYNNEEGRYLTGELDASACSENRVSNGPVVVGSRPCEWLTEESLSQSYLDVLFSERFDIKVYQRVVTLMRYDVDGQQRILPKTFRKTQWSPDHAFSNHRVRIDRISPLPLDLDSRHILIAARNASLSAQEMSVLRTCRSSNDGPCSTIDEPEFKIELYDHGSMPSAFILRIKNLRRDQAAQRRDREISTAR